MSDRFTSPSTEELAARGLNADGSPKQKATPKPAPKAVKKISAEKED